MKKIIFVKCLLMSAGMGLLMGMCFTIINQLKQNGTVQPVGVVIGMLISLVVSMLVGCVFNMKKICDRILGGWFHLNTFETNKKILFYLFEAVIGSVIFTPFNMFFNQMYGMYMGIKMSTGFPPFVKNFFDGIQFLFTQAHFLDAYLGGLLPSILIGIPISLVGTLMFGKITDKICGIDG